MPNIRSIHISFNSTNITIKTHSLVELSKKYNLFISFVYNITELQLRCTKPVKYKFYITVCTSCGQNITT